ncbi:hypothetical protein AURDEDRAFT_172761 [Auricularia subglabra TFB-10046 SS5]|nr:hypothetical protein AURDEDRAFT_172761 [Auricularia subglabra TFB-10046 SS5]
MALHARPKRPHAPTPAQPKAVLLGRAYHARQPACGHQDHAAGLPKREVAWAHALDTLSTHRIVGPTVTELCHLHEASGVVDKVYKFETVGPKPREPGDNALRVSLTKCIILSMLVSEEAEAAASGPLEPVPAAAATSSRTTRSSTRPMAAETETAGPLSAPASIANASAPVPTAAPPRGKHAKPRPVSRAAGHARLMAPPLARTHPA